MVALRLTARDRDALGESARHSTDARETRRALALLDLDAGEPPTRVAERYRVSRSTVYACAARWANADRPRGDRLRDAGRSGRPPDTRDAVGAALANLMPTAGPELNPVEGLWRHAKGRVLANEPTPDLGDSLGRVCEELFEMTGRERLQLAGVLSGNFWLPT